MGLETTDKEIGTLNIDVKCVVTHLKINGETIFSLHENGNFTLYRLGTTDRITKGNIKTGRIDKKEV